MKNVANRKCPICSNAACEVLHQQRFVLLEGHPLAAGYEVMCCETCGMVYADTTAEQNDYDRFYAQVSKYADSKTSTGAGDAPWDARRLQDTAQQIAGQVRRDARVLDVGCANGGLLSALKQNGFTNLTGVDPSPACAAHAAAATGVPVKTGSISALPSGIGQFDCVILSHVMEHVKDLRAACDALGTILADGGVIYVEVPDATRYADCVISPFQDFNTEHINHFSRETLANLMRNFGFEPIAQGEKTFDSPPPWPFPATFGFFHKQPDGSPRGKPTRDTKLRERIVAYIEVSHRMMRAIDAHLRNALPTSTEVIVWGTGQLAMKLLADTVLRDARIVAFIDGNPINQGRHLNGHPILAPEQARAWSAPILIASTLNEASIQAVIGDVLKLTNPLITLTEACRQARPANGQ